MFSKEYEMQQLYIEYLFDGDPKDYLQQGRDTLRSAITEDGIYDFSLLGVNLESIGLLWYSHDFVKNEFEKMWACVELYGHYASKQNRLNLPIFNYKNYRSAGIEFHVFFICSKYQNIGPISQILLFDNYETRSTTDFQLRFSYVHPHSDKESLLDTDGKRASFISRKLKLQPAEQESLKQVFGNTMVRHFTNSPFIAGSSIIEERPPGFFDVLGIFGQLIGKTQIPQLNQEDWKDLLPITNFGWSAIPSESYVCLLATGEVPEKAQEIAKQYALYLRKEEGYDFPIYDSSNKDQHEIFYILKADYSVCIGVFVFENMKTAVFNGLRGNWEGYVEKREEKGKLLPQENLDQFLKSKIESSLCKYDKARNSRKRQRQDEADRQIQRNSLYMTLSFFHKAKPHFPEDMKKLLSLRVAWIHPFHRRQKLLTELWPIFQSRYGIFDIDGPSKAMKDFIIKNTHDDISLDCGSERRYLVV